MSLLPATSHANPTTPFWATAGSGGGGGTDPVVIYSTTKETGIGIPGDFLQVLEDFANGAG